MSRIIVGLFLMAVGYLMVWKSDWLLRNVGSIPSAEKFLHTEGGSRLMYKLIGIFLLLIGALHITGLLEGTVKGLITLFFGYQFK
jgi:hypothetical protein